MKPKLVVLTGAGISAESGLRTFRDSDGLWEGYRVEEVATLEAWQTNPTLVLDFYNMRRRAVLDAQPNAAHLGLVDLEAYFDVHIITQNVDDLHERAGSKQVLHLHGEILKKCSTHNKAITYPCTTDMRLNELAPDGHPFRPFIVWFGEAVPALNKAAFLVEQADIFVIIGTSLQVYPAAGLQHQTQANIPKFIVDKNIPYISDTYTKIEMPASEGIHALKQALQTYTNDSTNRIS
jgi:NAD-dependent deacetylase